MPFSTALNRAMHFRKHGHEFGAADEVDYDRMADAFMFGAMNASTHECVRPNAIDRLRFDDSNRTFGAACLRPVVLKTFYTVSFLKVMRRGRNSRIFCSRVCENRHMRYRCPVCLFAGLRHPPADFHICPCCGTEFGNDDQDFTHTQLRDVWVASGAQLVFLAHQLPDWNPYMQLIVGGHPEAVPVLRWE